MCGLEDRAQGRSLQPRRFIDREMIDAGVAGDVDIRQFAVEAGARHHIGVFPLGQIEHAGDIARRRVGAGTIERHHQRDGYSLAVQLLRHRHHGIGAERVADENIGTVIAGAVLLRDVIDDGVGDRVVVDARIDAATFDLRGELIHAERKNVEKAAHQIDMRPRGAALG